MPPLLEGETLEGCTAENFVDCTEEEVLELAKSLDIIGLTLLVSSETGRLFLFEAREGNPEQLFEQIQTLRNWKAMGLHPDLYHNDAPDDVEMIEKATEWFREQLVHFFNTYSGSPKVIHVAIGDDDGAELDGKIDPDKLV